MADIIGKKKMMFMNTFVHFLEASVLVLVGFLVFQIYRCYQGFYQPASSTAHSKLTQSKLAIKSPVEANSEQNLLRRSLVSRLAVSSPELLEGSTIGLLPESEASLEFASQPSPEVIAPSSHHAILNDYIGEFFAEPVAESLDIKAFRAEVPVSVSDSLVGTKVSTASPEMNLAEPTVSQFESPAEKAQEVLSAKSGDFDGSLSSLEAVSSHEASLKESDEVIVVEFDVINPVLVDSVNNIKDGDGDGDGAIPTLVELTDVSVNEDDTVIKVISTKASNAIASDKVMSDKVVHAMLDEAKLVCAS